MRSEICHKICKKNNELYYFIDQKYKIHIKGAWGSLRHLIYSLLFILISSFAIS